MLEERAGSAQAEVSHLQGTAQHEELLKQEVMRAQSLAEESSEECKVSIKNYTRYTIKRLIV